METVATCQCGNQTWMIYVWGVKCCKCGREHFFANCFADQIVDRVKVFEFPVVDELKTFKCPDECPVTKEGNTEKGRTE